MDEKNKPKQRKWYDRIKISNFKITPMRIYVFILAVLIAVKVIFDIHGFGDFVSKLISFVLSVFSYLIIGAVLAFILNSYTDVWENKIFKKIKSYKVKRTLSIVIAYLLLYRRSLIRLKFLRQISRKLLKKYKDFMLILLKMVNLIYLRRLLMRLTTA